MKLKEKLAEDWAKRDSDLHRLQLNATEYYSYIAGFEKARELACEIEWNAAHNSEQLHKFKNMGEEEV